MILFLIINWLLKRSESWTNTKISFCLYFLSHFSIFAQKDSDSEYLAMTAKCCLLMFDINMKKNKTDLLQQWLEKAKECQTKTMKRAQVENSDSIEDYHVTYGQ